MCMFDKVAWPVPFTSEGLDLRQTSNMPTCSFKVAALITFKKKLG